MKNDNGFEFCEGYCGFACVDGLCQQIEGMDCFNCFFYKGCEDCCFVDTDICVEKIEES